jgi:predicted ATPase/DNA-binding winged helix-turn-helix (wHTH) protein
MPPLRFGPFTLDIPNARLTRDGQAVELPPKSFALLAHLAQRPDELVLKDQLLDAVWGRRFVSEGAVKTVVSELRAALGDDPKAPRWIETVQRRGYRFIGAGTALPAEATPPSDPAPDTPPASASASATTPEAFPGEPKAAVGNLPAGWPAPIGRETELADLATMLGRSRLVTLVGVAGVGKTRLALAAAQRARHAEGAWLVELAPLPAGATDAATLRSSIARAAQAAPGSAASDDTLVRALQGQDLLLLVDNAEHVLDPLAPLLSVLHAQLPRLKLLVTSREPLQVPGEQLLRVGPLSLQAEGDDPAAEAPALRLIVDRIAARLPGFAPDAAQRQALGRVCRALDGLPLALELAAARVPVLGVHGLAEHLGADAPVRLQLLTQAVRTALPHQRTLRATLDWSHALLTPAERRAFRRLGIFRGGFTLAAAQAVVADDGEDTWSVLDRLDALVEKSMVVAPTPGDGPPRFGLLESLREYALEQLGAAGEGDALARRLLAWQRRFWIDADRVSLTEPLLPWTARFAPELDNLRAALRWGHAAAADDAAIATDTLDLLNATPRLWQRLGLAGEGGAWCLALRERAEAHPDPLRRAGFDLTVATLCRFTALGSARENLARAERAATTFADAGCTIPEYLARYLAWSLAMEVDESVGRQPHLDRLRVLVQPGWSPLLTRFALSTSATKTACRAAPRPFSRPRARIWPPSAAWVRRPRPGPPATT